MSVTATTDTAAAFESAEVRARFAAAWLEREPAGFCVIDSFGVVRWSDDSYLRLHGPLPRQIIGMPWPPLVQPPSPFSQGPATWERLRRGEVIRCRLDDLGTGQHGWWEVVASPLGPAEDRAAEVGIAIFDRSADRAADEEAEKHRRLLAMARLGSGLAHDLNNLLFVVAGNLEIAELRVGDDQHLIAAFAKANEAIERARSFCQQLGVIAKGGDPQRRPVDLQPLLVHALREATAGAPFQLTYHFEDDLLPALVDEDQFRQIVRAVSRNACEVLDSHGQLRVTVRRQFLHAGDPLGLLPGDYLAVEFRDNGPGIEPSALPHIFDPYFTTRQHGHGLGLASAHAIARRHGGTMTAQSRPGKGMIFTLLLPAEPAGDRPAGAAPGPTVRQVRVLIVEDEPSVAELMKTMLGSLGYFVTVAADGIAARKEADTALSRGQPFEVALIDAVIPRGLGGTFALRNLRAVAPRLRAVLVTGYGDDPAFLNWRQLGFHGALRKPLTLGQLSDVVAAAAAA